MLNILTFSDNILLKYDSLELSSVSSYKVKKITAIIICKLIIEIPAI